MITTTVTNKGIVYLFYTLRSPTTNIRKCQWGTSCAENGTRFSKLLQHVKITQPDVFWLVAITNFNDKNFYQIHFTAQKWSPFVHISAMLSIAYDHSLLYRMETFIYAQGMTAIRPTLLKPWVLYLLVWSSTLSYLCPTASHRSSIGRPHHRHSLSPCFPPIRWKIPMNTFLRVWQ